MKFLFIVILLALFNGNVFADAKWERRVSELESLLEPLPVPYPVYDATGREVGSTVDGVDVKTFLDDHDVAVVLRAGKSESPDYTNTVTTNGVLYLVPDCNGTPYLEVWPGKAYTDSDHPMMDGVTPTVTEIARLPEWQGGGLVYADPRGTVFKFKSDTSGSIFSLYTNSCLNFDSPFIRWTALPAVEFTIDWVPPLTTIKP
jgi:hypothetical protein